MPLGSVAQKLLLHCPLLQGCAGKCGERQISRRPVRKPAGSELRELMSGGLAVGDWQRGMLSNWEFGRLLPPCWTTVKDAACRLA
jgi:hypothetical protein